MCNEITEEERCKLFDLFWQLSWNDKQKIVLSCYTQNMKQKDTTESQESSRRQFTYNYYLNIDNVKKHVCKTMFLNTFSLKEWMVHNWVKRGTHLLNQSSEEISTHQIERSSLRLSNDDKLQFLRSFLVNLEKIESHYCRQSSSKLYVETIFESKADVYKAYKQYCTESDKIPLSSCIFSENFDKMNLAIYKPRKDQCDTCCMYKVGNITKEEYIEHTNKKDLAQNEKAADKIVAENCEADVYTMDVQAVKTVPKLNASALYFKQKLQVNDFLYFYLNFLKS